MGRLTILAGVGILQMLSRGHIRFYLIRMRGYVYTKHVRFYLYDICPAVRLLLSLTVSVLLWHASSGLGSKLADVTQ